MANTTQLILEFLYFAVLAVAFAYGAIKMFGTKRPYYFKLYVMACGCRMLERLISFTMTLCGISSDGNITAARFFGILSFTLFILAANRGTVDGIVDDRCDPRNKKARTISFIVAALLGIVIVWIISLYARNTNTFTAAALFIAISLNVPACYYNLKHLLLPMDDMGFLRATKWCNIVALSVQGMGIISNVLSVTIGMDNTVVMVINMGVYIIPALLVMAAVKGAEIWEP